MLSLDLVILCAFAGSLTSDQLTFLLGRRYGASYLQKHPRWEQKVEKARAIIHRHQLWIILSFRFLYGLRTVIPVSIGLSHVPVRRFVVLNIIGAAIWAVAFGTGGYLFGKALETFLEDLKRYETTAMGVIVLIALIVWGVRKYREGKANGY